MKELFNVAKTSVLDKDGFIYGMLKGFALSGTAVAFITFFSVYGS